MENSFNTIEESYTLPSLGKIYNISVKPDVCFRAMTTNEEMKRLSKSETTYKVMAGIIDDCLKEKLGISSYDMCLGDYEYLLHKLRVTTYGPEYKMTSVCPYCYNKLDDTISLEDFTVNTYTDDFNNLLRITLPKSKDIIELNFQTPRMLDAIASDVKEFKKRSTGDLSILYTLMHSIKSINSEVLDVVKLEEYVRNMHMQDTRALYNQIEKINSSIGLNTDLIITCESCGVDYAAPFRFTSEFFGPTN